MTGFSSQYFTNSKKPEVLLVFLHGYNNNRAEMLPTFQYMLEKIPNLAITAPEGKYPSSKDAARKSWYKISGFDTDGIRLQNETPVAEIVRIYNQAGPALAETAKELNLFIDEIQKKYGFDNRHTYLAGFSQGAMLAIWTALCRNEKIAACFSLSGLAAANCSLNGNIKSRPLIYLLHGKQDKQVLFKCMEFTATWLECEKIPMCAKAFENLGHEISNDEMDYIAQTITGIA